MEKIRKISDEELKITTTEEMTDIISKQMLIKQKERVEFLLSHFEK